MVDESGERIHDCRKQTKGKIEAIEKTSCETSGNERAVIGGRNFEFMANKLGGLS